jgi:hypothetical protein
MPRRLLVAVLLMVAVGIAGTLVTAILLPHRDTAPTVALDRGSATTFGAAVGFDLTVTDVHIPDGAGRVTMALSFHNTSSSQQRADPGDFTFRDSSEAAVRPVFDTVCPHWTRADLHPRGQAGQAPRDADAQQVGPEFGTVPLCFPLARAASRRPTLVWEPDVGVLSTPIAIALR